MCTAHEVALPNAVDQPPITLTCRWPKGSRPNGFVVFCHGLGSSRSDYGELSNALAAHGYFVVHPTFPDSIASVVAAEPELARLLDASHLSEWSGEPVVKARMYEILHTPSYWVERVRIVRRVLDERGTVLASAGRFQAQAIPCAIVGHSFGAYTSQLMAGADIDMPGQGSTRYRDDRLQAAVLLSAQGRNQQGLRDGSWDATTCPVMIVTGTLDRGAKGQGWEWKSEPFTLAPPGGKYLAVLEGGDHYLGGIARADEDDGVPNHRAAIAQLTLAFLDAHLLQSTSAALWLQSIDGLVNGCPVLFKRK